MQGRRSRALGRGALALWLGVSIAASASAQDAVPAQDAARSFRSEGEFVAYDAEAKTVTLKVTKRGAGVSSKELPTGKPAAFKVEPEGSVISRTSVAIQGVKAGLGDIQAGRTVNVYWRPDETDPSVRFARKIDVVLSDEELDERYGTE